MSNLHAEEYEIYEGKSLVAQTYGGPLYQHCNDKSYGEAVMLAKKMAACEDLYEALEELCGGFTEQSYRAKMVNANCHNGICSIDKCGQCGRNLKAIKAMDKARGED